jgi:hypothetical protein
MYSLDDWAKFYDLKYSKYKTDIPLKNRLQEMVWIVEK